MLIITNVCINIKLIIIINKIHTFRSSTKKPTTHHGPKHTHSSHTKISVHSIYFCYKKNSDPRARRVWKFERGGALAAVGEWQVDSGYCAGGSLPLTRSRAPLFLPVSPGESLPTYIPNFRTDWAGWIKGRGGSVFFSRMLIKVRLISYTSTYTVLSRYGYLFH